MAAGARDHLSMYGAGEQLQEADDIGAFVRMVLGLHAMQLFPSGGIAPIAERWSNVPLPFNVRVGHTSIWHLFLSQQSPLTGAI